MINRALFLMLSISLISCVQESENVNRPFPSEFHGSWETACKQIVLPSRNKGQLISTSHYRRVLVEIKEFEVTREERYYGPKDIQCKGYYRTNHMTFRFHDLEPMDPYSVKGIVYSQIDEEGKTFEQDHSIGFFRDGETIRLESLQHDLKVSSKNFDGAIIPVYLIFDEILFEPGKSPGPSAVQILENEGHLPTWFERQSKAKENEKKSI